MIDAAPAQLRPGQLSAEQTAAVAAAFLAQPVAARNPFSVSGQLTWEGDLYHCKRGQRPFAGEADALRHAAELPRMDGVGIVPYAGFDAASNVLITHHVQGGSLFNALWNTTSPWRPWVRAKRPWAELMHAVGRWISRWHDHALSLTPPMPRGQLLDQLLAMIDDRLETFGRHSEARDPAPALLARIAEHTRILAADESWRDQMITTIHADLTPGNTLLHGDGKLTILDFGYTRCGFAMEDVVRMWCGIWEIGACSSGRERRLRPARVALLHGCGLPAYIVHQPPFRLLRIWNAVTRLNEAVTTRPRYARSTARLHRRLTDQHVRWLHEELQRDGRHAA